MWAMGKRHGPGEVQYRDKSSLRGVWENGVFVGQAEIKNYRERNDVVAHYSGQADAQTGLPHGSGESQTIGYPKTGEKYIGFWVHGKREG